jgi:hypothetical protein
MAAMKIGDERDDAGTEGGGGMSVGGDSVVMVLPPQ